MYAPGTRLFGPFIILAGIITAAPIVGDIPGVPTIMGIFTVVSTVQILAGSEQIWLPDWMLKRTVKKSSFCRAINRITPFAEFMDKWSKRRLSFFTNDTGTYVIGVICTLIALSMPGMELIPLSANIAGLALVFFGLSLVASDGVMALVAILFTAMTSGTIIYNFV